MTPPLLPGWLLQLALPAPEADQLLGDLDEEFTDVQSQNRGRVASHIWYWKQAAFSIAPMRRQARRRKSRDRARGVAPQGPSEQLVRDFRFGVRSLAKHPTYTLVAVLTLGLGIGANTAIYSVVEAVLLEPLPYDDPGSIYRAWKHRDDGTLDDFSFRVVDYKEARVSEVYTAVGADFVISTPVLIPGQDPIQVDGRMITGDFFDVFGVTPQLGRFFAPDEIAAGDALVAVVTHGFWTRMFGADPAALGQMIDLGSFSAELVGVLPENYEHVSGAPELFIPYTIGTSRWTAHWLDLYVRVRPEVDAGFASEEMNGVIERAAQADGRDNNWNATLEPLHTMVVGDVKTAVWAVFLTVSFVLLIACVNVANLGLARASARADEFAVRRALGAGRGRLVRQLMVEQLTLAAIGGAVGIGLSWAVLRGILAIAPQSVPRLEGATLDPTVLAFTAVVTIAVGLIFGLVPALAGTRTKPDGSRGGVGGGFLVRALVASQVALAVTLLVGAGLLVKTVQALVDQDLGFERSGALAFQVTAPGSRYPTGADAFTFFDDLRNRLHELPGVTAVGALTDLPLAGEGAVSTVNSEARVRAGVPGVTTLQRRATEGVFAATGTEVVDGRGFSSLDRNDGETVVVISQRLAEQFFPGESAVGRRVTWGNDAPEDDAWMTVVGVVADVRYRQMEGLRDPQIYQAHIQSTPRTMSVVMRTTGDLGALRESARATLSTLDPTLPMFGVTTLQGVVDEALAGREFTRTLFGMFAALALILTVAGIYGVLSFAVSRRIREIGVRMALGAGIPAVTRDIVSRAVSLAVVGVALGLGGAYAVYRGLESLFFGVQVADPLVYLGGAVAMGVAVLLASWVPARRACAVDPAKVLRGE